MKITKITFGMDKKLSLNYNSVGMHVGAEAEVGEDEGLAVAVQLRDAVESLLDGMLVSSAQGLTGLATKAAKK